MNLRTMIAYFETYLLTEKRTARNTWLSYKRDLNQLIDFLETNQLSDSAAITIDHIKQFLQFLYQHHIKARSVARKISAIKAFFLYAHERHGLPIITRELHLPKIEKKLPHYLSAEDIERLLTISQEDQSPHGKRNALMLLLLYSSGVRISELIQLKTADIREDISCITVNGKGGKQRLVPVPEQIITHIREYQRTVLPTLYKQTINSQTYFFPVLYAGTIRHMTRQAFFAILQQWCKHIGFKKPISPHVLRHSFATHMLKNGADLRSLQLLLGHESIGTVQIYTHVETSHIRAVYDKKHPRS